MTDRLRKEGKKCYIAFLDIEKAYDRVNRELMWKISKRVGFKDDLRNIIKSLYIDTKARYRLEEIQTDWVESKRGVRQGCILSPMLFAIFMEELTQRIKKLEIGVKIGEEVLAILLFADDIIMVAETAEDLQRMLDEVTRYGREMEVKFSKEKSQVMIINKDENEEKKWFLNGKEMEKVTKYRYTYLGIQVQDTGQEKERGVFQFFNS